MTEVRERVYGSIQAVNFIGDGSALTSIGATHIAGGTANTVAVFNGSGALTGSAHLAPSLGGTGLDLSGVSGTQALLVVGGVVTATTAVSATSVANSIVLRDGSGHIAVDFTGNPIVSTSDLTLSVTGNILTSSDEIYTKQAITSKNSTIYTIRRGLQTTSVTPTLIYKIVTVDNTVYSINATVVYCDVVGATVGIESFLVAGSRIAGVTHASSKITRQIAQTAIAVDTAVAVDTLDLDINVIGLSTAVNWFLNLEVTAQAF
jgi:hypothetical protein